MNSPYFYTRFAVIFGTQLKKRAQFHDFAKYLPCFYQTESFIFKELFILNCPLAVLAKQNDRLDSCNFIFAVDKEY